MIYLLHIKPNKIGQYTAAYLFFSILTVAQCIRPFSQQTFHSLSHNVSPKKKKKNLGFVYGKQSRFNPGKMNLKFQLQ